MAESETLALELACRIGVKIEGICMKSDSAARLRAAMLPRVSTSIVVVMLGLVSQPVRPSAGFLAVRGADSQGISQNPDRLPITGKGLIGGIVVNERQEPVARVTVQAFSVSEVNRQAQPGRALPPRMRASGSAMTDSEGRFQISGLDVAEYLVAAEPMGGLISGGPSRGPLYAATFYPSTADAALSVHVPAFAYPAAPIRIELVAVRGARISGSVASPSGRPAGGMPVRLFHAFGNFGSGSSVGTVSAAGTFEIGPLPPGWYRLTIGSRLSESKDSIGEFAEKLLELRDRDVDGLSLVLGPGASISGRVVPDAPDLPLPAGVRISATPTAGQMAAPGSITATVTDNVFRMTGLSGSYQFTAAADRPPFLAATRITVDGVTTPADAGVDLTDGVHDVVVFVAPREISKPTVDGRLSSGALMEQFKREMVFWRQFALAEQIVDRHDTSVLPSIVDWLDHEDRHLRGNAAFIFARLGDPRGFAVITNILADRSDRPEGQGVPTVSSDGRYHVARQIASDRYYAAHLLGDLRDVRAIPILVPLLKDAEVRSVVPWSLGQIGDKSAIRPLIDALADESPAMRVRVIYALEALQAREALPRLISLLNDHQRSNFGAQVSVAAAAKAAIAKLQ